jgi:hypothetical protein
MDMKYFKVIFVTILLFFYADYLFSQNIIKDTFKVEKIDSIGNYYLIYISNPDVGKYKIISNKNEDKIEGSSIINTGNSYLLTIYLYDTISNDISSLDADFEIEEGVYIAIEYEWGNNVYYSDEIRGLYYIGHIDKKGVMYQNRSY